jgi:tetratricopeptide (TPR) repeat protein
MAAAGDSVQSPVRRRKVKKIVWGAISLLFVTAIVLGQAQKSEERFDNEVRDDFFAGMGGNIALFDRAMKTCEEALAKNPKNASAMVWHGAGLYVRGGILISKGDYANGKPMAAAGSKEMADAVALEPESVQTRIPRAAIFISSARRMDDSISKPILELAVDDYEKVLQLEKSSFDTLPTHSKGELLGGLADGYRRLGNYEKSSQYLERMVKEMPGTEYQTQAKRWLVDLPKVDKQDRFCIGCHMGANP